MKHLLALSLGLLLLFPSWGKEEKIKIDYLGQFENIRKQDNPKRYNSYVRKTVLLEIKKTGENRYEVGVEVYWEPGADVDLGGVGSVDQEGVLHFTFEDSFGNEGKGTFKKDTKKIYLLELKETKKVDGRAARQYGQYSLKKEEAKVKKIN